MGFEASRAGSSGGLSLRRRAFVAGAAGCAGGALLGSLVPSPAPAAVVRRSMADLPICAVEDAVVDQITDLTTRVPTEIFRFVPDLVCIDVGQSVRFLNSRSQHTVHSVDELTPEGAESFSIVGAARHDIVFEVPGIHGVDCARHGRYGMVMLVVVGPIDGVPSAYRSAIESFGADRGAGFARLFDQLEATVPG